MTRLLLIIFFTFISISVFATEKMITHHYIELEKVDKVSRFRSGIGHNYSFDPNEPCRNMKHYFVAKSNDIAEMPKISAPVNGTIIKITPEWAGDKVELVDNTNQYTFIIFHVVRLAHINAGSKVNAGELLGTHIGPQTYSDIAVRNAAGELMSYFELLTDDALTKFVKYAPDVRNRTDLIISAEERNAFPLQCGSLPEERFLNPGTITNWIELQ